MEEDYFGGRIASPRFLRISKGSSARTYTGDEDEDQEHGKSGRNSEAGKLNGLITHLFLPKRTPDQLEPDLAQIESLILDHALQATSQMSYRGRVPYLSSAERMLKFWTQLLPKSLHDEQNFIKNLQKDLMLMQTGDTIAVFVSHQNCTLMITMVSKEHTRIDTFRSSLPSETVMSTVGSLGATFPETSEIINNKDLLTSVDFAKQLFELCTTPFETAQRTCTKADHTYTDKRDVPNPVLVNDWIVGVLSPATDCSPKSPQISKKIRDQITCEMSSRARPFRRSGLWMSVKVALQLKLIESLEGVPLKASTLQPSNKVYLYPSRNKLRKQDEASSNSSEEMDQRPSAKLIYKLIILRMLANICQTYMDAGSISIDLASQMMAKVARRTEKVAKIEVQDGDKMSQALRTKTLEDVHKVLTALHEKVNSIWKSVEEPNLTDACVLPILKSRQDFLQGLKHSLSWLDQHVARATLEINEGGEELNLHHGQSKTVDVKERLKRYTTLASIIKGATRYDDRVWLHDTERFVKYSLESENDSAKIWQLIYQYATTARSHYNQTTNPIGLSQMTLVLLKAIERLDKIATQKFPLLLEYQSGINAQRFDNLSLPFVSDMAVLDSTLNYFMDRDAPALRLHSSIVESSGVDSSTFPVRYASQSDSMIRLRNKILEDTEKAIKQKQEEVGRVRLECNELQIKISAEGHFCKCEYEEYIARVKRKGQWREVTRKRQISTCQRCILQATYDSTVKSVAVYERPLPPQINHQYAVVFELQIPEEISALRSSLALLNKEILCQTILKGAYGTPTSTNIKWLSYSPMKGYINGTLTNTKVHLGSKSLAASNTHYTRLNNPSVFSDFNSNFVVNNGLGCIYSASDSTSDHPLKLHFEIAKTADGDRYESLQSQLETTSHTQRKVIAMQHLCPHNLTLEEFIAFGSLRAGHRIQLRNLFRSIYDRSLSLEREPVLALILQTLWHVGVTAGQSGEREAHADFTEESFANEFLQMLGKLVEGNKTNFNNPYILLVAIVICNRIWELNESCRDKCYLLLRKCRKVVDDWVVKINYELKKKESESSSRNLASLKTRLLEITICSGFSFHLATSYEFQQVIKDEVDLLHWFKTLSRMHLLTIEERLDDKNLSFFSKILLAQVKILPLGLDMENRLYSGTMMMNALNQFVSQRWSKASDSGVQLVNWHMVEENSHILIGQYAESRAGDLSTPKQHIITFDFVLGSFLVNGYSDSVVPAEISQHTLFRRYFNSATFRVQKYLPRVRRTISKWHGHHYEFEDSGDLMQSRYGYGRLLADGYRVPPQRPSQVRGNLTIWEVHDDFKLELLNPDLFRGHIGNSFIDNYTHWLHANEKKVFFRRITDHEDQVPEPEYVLDQNEGSKAWQLYNQHRKEHIMSIQAEPFKVITNSLSRLEMSNHINVAMDKLSGDVTAKLPRLNLSFKIVNGGFRSIEYPEYKISLSQAYGTLTGLKNGLSMDCEQGYVSKRLLLVPHGQLGTTDDPGRPHHQTRISLNNLRQPPFFVYEFDDVLSRLKADKSKSAWLYLAALHGATSSSLQDQFTRLTGTEAAVRILQTAFVWSSSPYDIESLATLEIIKSFSPVRKYYGHSSVSHTKKETMEIIEWPKGLPSMAAYDGYAILVEKLIEDSERLSMLHKSGSTSQINVEKSSPLSPKLRLRGYFRHLKMYNDAVVVEKTNFKPDILPLKLTGKVDNLTLRTSPNLNLAALQTVANARFTNALVPTNLFGKNKLLPFLITKEHRSDQEGFSCPTLSLTAEWSLARLLSLNLRHNWVQLYSLAISEDNNDKQVLTLALSAMAYKGDPLEQIFNLHYISILAALKNEKLPIIPIPEIFTKSPDGVDQASTVDSVYVEKEVEQILKRCGNEVEKTRKSYAYDSDDYDYEDYYNYDSDDSECGYRSRHRRQLRERYTTYLTRKPVSEEDASRIATQFKSYWPCENITIDEDVQKLLEGAEIEVHEAIPLINSKLRRWFRNLRLKMFLDEVQQFLNSAYDMLHINQFPQAQIMAASQEHTFHRFQEVVLQFRIEDDEQLRFLLDELSEGLEDCSHFNEAVTIFHGGSRMFNEDGVGLWEQVERCTNKIANLKRELNQVLTNKLDKRILALAGISARINPTSLLHCLLSPGTNEPLKTYAGALAVLWSQLKRLNRCIVLKSKDANSTELHRETATSNSGSTPSWSRSEHPEWLLLELELDITIRPIQVEVAQQMMSMPNDGNGVTQLNMGEGKTSVIVPMLCATLPNKDSLCRVTVLNSIFSTNLNILTFAIGGLLNKRVYTFPCRRDMKIDEECLGKLFASYKECLQFGGTVLALPEHRLSFRLLGYDSTLKKNRNLGQQLLNIENWLREHARDVLDESDELLSVKYQLVYTIGAQLHVDGGELRWNTCQALLKIVQNFATQLLGKYGTSVVEFDSSLNSSHPHQFVHLRLLNKNCYNDLYSHIADQVLKQLSLTEAERSMAKSFLISDNIQPSTHVKVMNIFKDTPEQLQKILLVSGYIRRGVVALALSKRWRVEYGVDPKGLRRMAVPFRAKDVAAERTEFGQPDLAIVLTHLSYYYSGLSDDELVEVFDALKCKPGPDSIYTNWIQSIPEEVVLESLRSYHGLNMKDAFQRTDLFNMFRKHKAVIDFWLANKVFTKEAKQFPGKIAMTAWDLCYERNKHPVSGFSGTNDSSILLPLTIAQQDLEELRGTNEKMEKVLLQPENGDIKGLKMGVTCLEILKEMKDDGLRVLIDSGALMLDCDNEQVAQLWLDTDVDIDAAVYFSKDGEILVKCRSDESSNKGKKQSFLVDTPLELSPFRGRLDKCGVFLDDQHTRGTDLKFPVGSKACVTIGSRMRREKLIQACMRMRKLGGDHSVCFYLSHEAFDKVGSLKRSIQIEMLKLKAESVLAILAILPCHETSSSSEERMGTEIISKPRHKSFEDEGLCTADIIRWVTANTVEFNEDGLIYWSIAGKNYAQKLASEDNFHHPFGETPYRVSLDHSSVDNKLDVLAKLCVDDEVMLLKDMYGSLTKTELLHKLIPNWFEMTAKKLATKNNNVMLPDAVMQKFYQIRDSVVERCSAIAPNKTHTSSMMEEEQEKELEKETEVEEEQQVERPREVKEAQAYLHPNVRRVIIEGGGISLVQGILRLSDMFKYTTFWHDIQPECWGTEVFATQDFVSVIDLQHSFFKTDSHLRPIQFIASCKVATTGSVQLLLLSPHEVNEMMPYFRARVTKCHLHMFSMRKTDKQDFLINNRNLMIPPCSLPEVTLPPIIQESGTPMIAIFLASGSLYFSSMEQQQAFARFLALVPISMRSSLLEEEAPSEAQCITKTGFLVPQVRDLFHSLGIEPDAFKRDPTGIVKKILQCRHPVLSEVAHVTQFLDKIDFVDIP